MLVKYPYAMVSMELVLLFVVICKEHALVLILAPVWPINTLDSNVNYPFALMSIAHHPWHAPVMAHAILPILVCFIIDK